MKRLIVAVALAIVLQGCAAQQPPVFMLADFLAAKVLPYDSPPQVIYRIDDHRFVTLENYRSCNYGQAYYNDTRAGIKANLGRTGIENYQGQLINADPTGKNLAFPASGPPGLPTRDRGLDVYLRYSTDGGKTFKKFPYMERSLGPFEDSKKYIVVVTGEALFVVKKYQYRMDLPDYDLSVRKYLFDPTGSSPILSDSAWASKRKLMPAGLRAPSNQDRITCDPSIKPTNPDAPLAR